MANKLDEVTGNVNTQGRDINVIEKQLPMEVGTGSKVFEIILWCLLIIPGLIFMIMKISKRNYFYSLEQKIQSGASEIDNTLEQRVIVMENLASLVAKSVDLDKSTMTEIAALRSGATHNDVQRNEISKQIDNVSNKINLAFENYPDLQAHESIKNAMQQNIVLQREISAARSNYNSLVSRWNQDIQVWPTAKIVAAKEGFTTRIPFTTSAEIKASARKNFF
ncbi:LemA family protein [Mesoplasma photuris]|uniref:LemA family protein n=1 Tax=Mesoplasma photuris TaxID=217731 RepID=UPI0004E2317A|nr:LemA family protein [Mesoplasma photuris]